LNAREKKGGGGEREFTNTFIWEKRKLRGGRRDRAFSLSRREGRRKIFPLGGESKGEKERQAFPPVIRPERPFSLLKKNGLRGKDMSISSPS